MLAIRTLLASGSLFALLHATPAAAQTIYPVTRAEILANAKFDLKVEVPSTKADISVTVNGRDAAQFFGMEGNLPFTQPQGVHAADDVVLTAMGPGAELFKGRIDNTRVFRVMATALGLAAP